MKAILLAVLLFSPLVTSASMINSVNKERAKVNLPTLKADADLSAKAKSRAEELCKKKQWSHDGWRNRQGAYKHFGENLAEGFGSDSQRHKALMKSPSHRANILNKNYKNVGIGSTKCKGKVIKVQLFGG